MTLEEQAEICKAIAVSCMWGEGGIAGVILDNLEETVPTSKSWATTYAQVSKRAQREAVGVVTTTEELERIISQGYFVCNYDEHGASLIGRNGQGLRKYVLKDLADKCQKEENLHRKLREEFFAGMRR